MNTVQHTVTQVFPVRQKPPQGALRTNTADISVEKSTFMISEITEGQSKTGCVLLWSYSAMKAMRQAAQR